MANEIKTPKGWRKLCTGAIPREGDRKHISRSLWITLTKKRDSMYPVQAEEYIIREVAEKKKKAKHK